MASDGAQDAIAVRDKFKQAFAGTDYEDCLKEYSEEDTVALKKIFKWKLANEIEYIQSVSGPQLQKFIQIIRVWCCTSLYIHPYLSITSSKASCIYYIISSVF